MEPRRAEDAAKRPRNAPVPVVRFQNMPNRKVAKIGAFTKPNTSWMMSIALSYIEAKYAAAGAQHYANHSDDFAGQKIMPVAFTLHKIGLIQIVSEHGVEGGDVAAMPDMNDASKAVSASPSRPGGQYFFTSERMTPL